LCEMGQGELDSFPVSHLIDINAMIFDDLTVPIGAVLGGAFLDGVIHVDDIKTLQVPQRPLKAVHQ
jgi:hypothetical protein